LGKLVKLGAGLTNTHSKYGDARIDTLISCALEAGAALRVLRKIKECVSTDAVLECLTGGLAGKTAAVLRGRVEDTLIRHTGGRIDIGVICFSGAGENAAICFQNEAAGQLLDAFSP
jgi:cobalt-precorrin-5B (C1)-methyltransferase